MSLVCAETTKEFFTQFVSHKAHQMLTAANLMRPVVSYGFDLTDRTNALSQDRGAPCDRPFKSPIHGYTLSGDEDVLGEN